MFFRNISSDRLSSSVVGPTSMHKQKASKSTRCGYCEVRWQERERLRKRKYEQVHMGIRS